MISLKRTLFLGRMQPNEKARRPSPPASTEGVREEYERDCPRIDLILANSSPPAPCRFQARDLTNNGLQRVIGGGDAAIVRDEDAEDEEDDLDPTARWLQSEVTRSGWNVGVRGRGGGGGGGGRRGGGGGGGGDGSGGCRRESASIREEECRQRFFQLSGIPPKTLEEFRVIPVGERKVSQLYYAVREVVLRTCKTYPKVFTDTFLGRAVGTTSHRSRCLS